MRTMKATMQTDQNKKTLRNLTEKEIDRLDKQHCFSDDWSLITIDPELDLGNISHVRFIGAVQINRGVRLRDIPGGIGPCNIGEYTRIENVASLRFEPGSSHGIGTKVNVLDETGSRAVYIYPGLSAQIATLMAREPDWLNNGLKDTFKEFIEARISPAKVGSRTIIRDCGPIKNVSIGDEITISGALKLENGTIINNAAPGLSLVNIGAGVVAENFIVEDGTIGEKVGVKNCYIGQGTELGKGFTAHDSLFFANCVFENGEAVSILAGPYSVSMHKGTLLIGCQTSFLNAGSSSNQSNHMYKLGPIHWGILERGVKTSSGSYLMLGAKIGAFSLLMGSHKTHPDSSFFPFSYLFGDEKGATVVVPAAMLRSCGLLRDETKWPARDRRLKREIPLFDRIIFNVLNPYTVDNMLKAIDIIKELTSRPADDDLYVRHKGMKFTRASLDRAKKFYTYAIFKYLSLTLPNGIIPDSDNKAPEDWVDVGGQIMTRSDLKKVLASRSVKEAEDILNHAFLSYRQEELLWISRRFDDSWRKRQEDITYCSKRFDQIVEEDREEYLENLKREDNMLKL